MPSPPLAIALSLLILIGVLIALIVVLILELFRRGASKPTPPTLPTPPAYEQPLGGILALLRKINDEDPDNVSMEDCTKLRSLLDDAKGKGLPTNYVDAIDGIIKKLCP